jgi:hypothetical protein
MAVGLVSSYRSPSGVDRKGMDADAVDADMAGEMDD